MSTLVDKIEQMIREDIYNGRLAAGEPLKQVELAHHYGTSPIPLREALQRLQTDGLVEYFAYRGAIVARMKKGEAADIADLRNALESLAFRIAWPTLDDAQINLLAGITEQMESPEATNASFLMARLDEYYRTLLAKCERPLLLEMIQTNLKRAIRYYAEVVRVEHGRPVNAPSRRRYIDALRERDYEKLVACMAALHQAYVDSIEAHFE